MADKTDGTASMPSEAVGSIIRDMVVGQVALELTAQALGLDLALEGGGEELQAAAGLKRFK
jgi:hypothetical protein